MSLAEHLHREHIQRIRDELDAWEIALDESHVPEPAGSTPRVFSREEIGLRPVKGRPAPLAVGSMLHISGGKPPSEKFPAFRILRTMQHYHIDVRGWDDVGYNWGVCNRGHVYSLRGAMIQGAHAKGYNRTHNSIVWLGGHEQHSDVKPSLLAFDALTFLLEDHAKKLGPGSEMLGHREKSRKSCPGDEIFAWLTAYRANRAA